VISVERSLFSELTIIFGSARYCLVTGLVPLSDAEKHHKKLKKTPKAD
jgi:hypothetical protein